MNSVIYILDDDPHMCRALNRLLGSNGYTVKTYASAHEFLAEKRPARSGCLILDLKMPDIDGLNVQQVLACNDELLPIIFISGYGDVPTSVQAMKAGAIDFLTKPFQEEELIAVVRTALERAEAAQQERDALRKDREAFDRLTSRERDVCLRIAQGLLNKQVGFELGTTEKTVKAQRARVMQKLGANSLADVVRLVERLRAGAKTSPPSKTEKRSA